MADAETKPSWTARRDINLSVNMHLVSIVEILRKNARLLFQINCYISEKIGKLCRNYNG